MSHTPRLPSLAAALLGAAAVFSPARAQEPAPPLRRAFVELFTSQG